MQVKEKKKKREGGDASDMTGHKTSVNGSQFAHGPSPRTGFECKVLRTHKAKAALKKCPCSAGSSAPAVPPGSNFVQLFVVISELQGLVAVPIPESTSVWSVRRTSVTLERRGV